MVDLNVDSPWTSPENTKMQTKMVTTAIALLPYILFGVTGLMLEIHKLLAFIFDFSLGKHSNFSLLHHQFFRKECLMITAGSREPRDNKWQIPRQPEHFRCCYCYHDDIAN